MEITDTQYQEALQTIYKYRTERGMDFYMPINTEPLEDRQVMTMEEFRRYIQIGKSLRI